MRRYSTVKTAEWILPREQRSELYNRWRGFQPWPGAFTALNGKKLIVHRMAMCIEPPPREWATPSRAGLLVEDRRILAACADNTWLELLEVQLEGKKRLTAAEFLRGNPLAPDTRLRLSAMSAISAARKAAFDDSAWPSNAEKITPTICCEAERRRHASHADRNLATALVLGVLRWQIRLDHRDPRSA